MRIKEQETRLTLQEHDDDDDDDDDEVYCKTTAMLKFYRFVFREHSKSPYAFTAPELHDP